MCLRLSTDAPPIGDKRRPVCTRCEAKGLDCKPVQKKAVFRNGSTAKFDASFTQGQVWVNSKPKTWRAPRHSATWTEQSSASLSSRPYGGSVFHSPSPNEIVPGLEDATSPPCPSQPGQNERPNGTSPQNASFLVLSSPELSPMSSQAHHGETSSHSGAISNDFPSGFRSAINATEDDASSPYSYQCTPTASESVQESCLLRYFIEELSAWVRAISLAHGKTPAKNSSLIIVMTGGISS